MQATQKSLAESAGVSDITLRKYIRALRAAGLAPPPTGLHYPAWFKEAVQEQARELLAIGLKRHTVCSILVDLTGDSMGGGPTMHNVLYAWLKEVVEEHDDF